MDEAEWIGESAGEATVEFVEVDGVESNAAVRRATLLRALVEVAIFESVLGEEMGSRD